MNKKILVVEDSERLRKFIVTNLIKAGYQTCEADSVKSAFEVLKSTRIGLVLLDLHLIDSDGIEVLKTIRRQSKILPVIIVSSLTDQITKVNSFNYECDDYITKPFYVDELLMRVERNLKRTKQLRKNYSPIVECITSGPFVLDLHNLTCSKNETLIVMRKKIFKLMLYFVRNPNQILSTQILFDRVWNSVDKVNENSIYVHIRELRELIENNPSQPVYITSVRGLGYRYSISESE